MGRTVRLFPFVKGDRARRSEKQFERFKNRGIHV